VRQEGLTASIRSQEDFFFLQETLAKYIAQNRRSLVPLLDPLLQASQHLVDVHLLHLAVLASILLLFIKGPALDAEGLSGYVAQPACTTQDWDVVASRRADCALADCGV
jgi:hypothetical protein